MENRDAVDNYNYATSQTTVQLIPASATLGAFEMSTALITKCYVNVLFSNLLTYNGFTGMTCIYKATEAHVNMEICVISSTSQRLVVHYSSVSAPSRYVI